jgi:hypothetical protein
MNNDNAQTQMRRPTPMEFGSMPLDPMYAWGIRYEPVGALIEGLSDLIEQLAKEQYESGTELSDEALEKRFMDWLDARVADGTLQRLNDDPDPVFGRVLGPKRWLRSQRIRMARLIAWWQERGGPDI